MTVKPIGAAIAGALLAMAAAPSVAGADAGGLAHIGGGTENADYPAVVFVRLGGEVSTGTVVGRRTVLVAGHAVPAAPIDYTRATVFFGARATNDGADADRAVDIVDAVRHRYYEVEHELYYYDIGLVLLAEDAGVEPMLPSLAPLDTVVDLGDSITRIAYGATASDYSGARIKREALFTVSTLTRHLVGTRDDDVISCPGDSGGPALVSVEGALRILAIGSLSDCASFALMTPVNRYWEEFVEPVLARWEGDCPFDGTCEVGCSVPDPDCDPCAFNDQCAQGCPSVDLDCPLRGRYLDSCLVNADCESGYCVDDDGGGYCSLPCFTTVTRELCGDGFSCAIEPSVDPQQRVCLAPPPPPPDGCCSAGGTAGAAGGTLLYLLLALFGCLHRRVRRAGG